MMGRMMMRSHSRQNIQNLQQSQAVSAREFFGTSEKEERLLECCRIDIDIDNQNHIDFSIVFMLLYYLHIHDMEQQPSSISDVSMCYQPYGQPQLLNEPIVENLSICYQPIPTSSSRLRPPSCFFLLLLRACWTPYVLLLDGIMICN